MGQLDYLAQLRNIFYKYENQGIPYRGRCDEIKEIVKVISEHMPKNDLKLNNQLINDYYQFKYVKKIFIDNNHCTICFDEGVVSFSNVPDKLKSKFGNNFYDKQNHLYCFTSQCHSVTSKFLEMYRKSNICAITSLCVNINYKTYFHSYIWDVNNDMIIDFSRNLMMKKKDYDYLFVTKEINVFDYNDYVSNIVETDYCHCGEDYCRLLYLALVKLYNEQNQSNLNFEKPPKSLNYYINSFSRNVLNKGL